MKQVLDSHGRLKVTGAGGGGGGGITALNFSAGTTSSDISDQIVFSNSNGISFGLDGQTITASHNGLTSQSNQAVSAGNGSFTFQTFQFNNSNGVSFSTTTGSGIVASHNGLTSQSNQAFSAAGGSSAFQTLSFNNANGATFSNNGGAVELSYTVPSQSNQTGGIYFVGNTTGESSSSTYDLRTLSIDGGGIISAGWSNSTLRLSATQSNQAFSAAGGSSAFQTLSFNNANGITFSNNGGAVEASYTVPSVTNSSWTVSDAATSATVGRLAFTNSNGLTLSLSTSNNGNHTVIGSYTVPTVTNSSWTVSDAVTSQTIGRLAFTNSNGLTMTLSTSNNGNATVIGSYTVPTVTNSSWTVSDAVTSQTIGRLAFTNANGLTMTLSTSNNGNATVFGSYTVPTVTNSSLTMQAGASTLSSVSRVHFGDSNKISFGASTSNNGSITITASFDPINIGMSTGGNTAGTTGTFDGAGLQYILAGGTNVTLSQSSNASSVTLSINGMSFSNSNNITFGANAGTMTASYLEPLQSYFQHSPNYIGTTAFTMGGSSNFVQPFMLPFNISASYMRIANSWAFGSTTGGTTANVSLTLNNSQSIWVNIYSKGVGASSKSLQYITGGSVSLVFQVRAEIGAASNNQTVSHNFTYPSSEGGAQGNFATNYNVNSASYNISTTHLTSFNGFRWLDIPFAASLTKGDYWLAVAQSTATATTGGVAAMTNVTARNTYVAVSQINTNVALMGVSSNMSTAPWLNGLGLWSTNSIGASTSSIGLASISSSANQPILPFQMIREA